MVIIISDFMKFFKQFTRIHVSYPSLCYKYKIKELYGKKKEIKNEYVINKIEA
jgi:hypothetical protein